MSGRDAAPTLHGVALVIRDAGVLIRGRSGAGKSRMGEDLVGAAHARGWFARLVADDRVRFAARAGRLILSPHPAIAGFLERRGQGVVACEHETSVVLRLVIDLVDADFDRNQPARMPGEDESRCDIAGVRLPRLCIGIGDEGASQTVLRLIAEGA